MAATGLTVRPVGAVSAQDDLQSSLVLKEGTLGDYSFTLVKGKDIWLTIKRENLGIALRCGHQWSLPFSIRFIESKRGYSLVASSALGALTTRIEFEEVPFQTVRVQTWLEPHKALTLANWPRDLYTFADNFEVGGAQGIVHAAQRGLNSGLIFATVGPNFGDVLYLQDFSSLQDYYLRTETTPDTSVGGQWPELGYGLPSNEDKPLQPGKKIQVLDTNLVLAEHEGDNPRAVAKQFLNLTTVALKRSDHNSTQYADWPARAKKTLKALVTSPLVTRKDYGQLYLRPYVDAEYPDSMTQLSVIAALTGYGRWRGRSVPLADRLSKGVTRFYDPDLCTLRRYLPNVGKDKNPDEVDAWYLYHPLKNLGHLAKQGVPWANDLFFASIDFGIRAAHRFNYKWPVKYNIKNFEVITHERKPGDPGQSDVGGIFAYVMLQAHELTGDGKYLEEAVKAIKALDIYGFDLLYQSNLTSIGASACAWLHKLTNDPNHLDQCCHFLANLLHNSLCWRSKLGHAKDYDMYMGVSCLHDGPYMAAYECFESFGALREVLIHGNEVLSEPARYFAAESSRHALNRARFFFPDQLPEDAIATDIRNGKIVRDLSIPLEDLYGDGRPAGEVGQEVYGAGAAFLFCIHAYKPLKLNSGWLYCEYPVMDLSESEGVLKGRTLGSKHGACRLKLVGSGRQQWTCDVGAEVGKNEFIIDGDTTFLLTKKS